MVCVQPDAPVQSYLQFRLGSEIAKVGTSRFALPLEVIGLLLTAALIGAGILAMDEHRGNPQRGGR